MQRSSKCKRWLQTVFGTNKTRKVKGSHGVPDVKVLHVRGLEAVNWRMDPDLSWRGKPETPACPGPDGQQIECRGPLTGSFEASLKGEVALCHQIEPRYTSYRPASTTPMTSVELMRQIDLPVLSSRFTVVGVNPGLNWPPSKNQEGDPKR